MQASKTGSVALLSKDYSIEMQQELDFCHDQKETMQQVLPPQWVHLMRPYILDWVPCQVAKLDVASAVTKQRILVAQLKIT